MMLQEFESRTGFYPDHKLYAAIEAAYMESNLDKDAFCEAYKANKDGIAEKIQRETALSIITEVAKHAADKTQYIEEIAKLRKELESEQEWKPYDRGYNVKQERYADLVNARGTRILTEEEAKQLIADEFGFDISKVTIIYVVDKEEINRHNQCRTVGTISREPLYNATDWNYIRFNCSNWYYEMFNGQLHQFYC